MADLFDILLAKNLSGGGGGGGSAIAYTSIVDNGDNTITATDDKGVEHTIAYTVGADGKITSVTLDGKTQTVTYEGDVLAKIGNTDVDIESVPTANEFPITVTFMNGVNIYGKVGITDGMKIAEPAEPSGEGTFAGWYDNSYKITFPYAPTEDKNLVARFTSVAHPELEFSGANTLLFSSSKEYHKWYDGTVILGKGRFHNEDDYLCIVSIDPISSNNVKTDQQDIYISRELQYNNKTYYIDMYRYLNGVFNVPNNKYYNFGIGFSMITDGKLKELLDYYYGVN